MEEQKLTQIQSEVQQQQQQILAQIPKIPKRPQINQQNLKKVTFGQEKFVTNHFSIKLEQKWKIMNYYIDITPEVKLEEKELFSEILGLGMRQVKEKLKNCVASGANIWSPTILNEAFVINVKKQDKEYGIKIAPTKLIDFKDIDTSNATNNQFSQLLNILIKQCLKASKFNQVDRKSIYYNEEQTQRVNDCGVDIMIGLKTSTIISQTKEIILQIDFASRILRQESALSFMKQFQDRNEIKNSLVGLTIMKDYGVKKTFQIHDVDFNKNPTDTFQKQDGSTISYLEYYQKSYGVQIKDKKQPLLLNIDKKDGKKTYLVPEIVRMTGLTDEMRSDFKFMRALTDYIKLSAEEKMSHIKKGAELIQSKSKEYGFSLQTKDFPQCMGYVIKAPQIQLGDNSQVQPKNGIFNFKQPILFPAVFDNWVLIYQQKNKQSDDEVDEFVANMQKASKTFGIAVKEPCFLCPKGSKVDEWIQKLDSDIKKNGPPQIVLCFIPKSGKNSIYPKVKEFLHTYQKVPSQFVVNSTLNKNTLAVCSKIILQMNAKLQMPLWKIPKPVGLSDKTMIVGIDVFHKLIQNKKSCLGFVSSLDKDFSKFFYFPIIQEQGKQLCENVGLVMQKAVKAYFKQNKFFPECIILYRDGVGEGQKKAMIETEIVYIINGFQDIDKNFKPEFAFIMINKKNSTRFFEYRDKNSSNIINPTSGTLISDDNIQTTNFEWSLVAQNVTQGTANPTSFKVLYNSTSLSQEVFWQLTFFQCFNYTNWTGAVKVPSCVQYAKKLAFFIGDSIPNVNIKADDITSFPPHQ